MVISRLPVTQEPHNLIRRMMLAFAHEAVDEAIRLSAPSASPDIEVAEEVEDEVKKKHNDPWRVILYNDSIHSFDEVILQLIKATGCSTSQAEAYAWQAHLQGKAAVYEGAFEECFRVQAILREIQLVTEIEG